MKIKNLISIQVLMFIYSSVLLGQISVAPVGSAGSQSSFPVGIKKAAGACLTQNCMEFNVTPSCFGTNLRAYSAKTQMRQDQDILIKLKLKKDGKTDNVHIQYPASLTFGSTGTRQDCTLSPGQNLESPSPKDIYCTNPGTSDSIRYTLMGWKSQTNPVCYANGGNHGNEYCSYAGVILDANTASVNADSNIKCIYKFYKASINSWKISSDKVSCHFDPIQADKAASMKVKLNGVELDSEVEKSAFVNKIYSKVFKSFNTIPTSSLIHHGKLKPISTPSVSYQFFQINSNGTERPIANIVEESGFVPQAGNRAFNLVVKHPGVKGFCGGYYSPLMFFFDGSTPQFDGVSLFPLYGVTKGARVYWPEKNSKGYFLVDMKGKKVVSSHDQLFGKDAIYENGFKALAVHDKNKDGVINKKDKIFSTLKLWNDKDGNGLSNSNEIVSLDKMGVKEINLKYRSNSVTKYGSRARAKEKSTFTFSKSGKIKKGRIIDVWLSEIN